MKVCKLMLIALILPLATLWIGFSGFGQISLEFDESLYPFIRPAVQEIVDANWSFPMGLRIRVGEPVCPQQETVGIYCSSLNFRVIVLKPLDPNLMLEVLRHELGHATAEVMGIMAEITCNGADYRHQFVSSECSWSEGWADFFAAFWARSPYIRMADINLDTYTPRDTQQPWVSDVTWTLWTLNKLYGWEHLKCALDAYPRPTTLHSFLANLSNQCEVPAPPPKPPPTQGLLISPNNGSTTRTRPRVNAIVSNPLGTAKRVTAIEATGCTVGRVRPSLPLTLAAGESLSVRVSLRCPRGGATWTLNVSATDLPNETPRAASSQHALIYYNHRLEVGGFMQVQLFDLAGRRLVTTECGAGANTSLPNGVYLYALRDCATGQIHKGKLVVMR